MSLSLKYPKMDKQVHEKAQKSLGRVFEQCWRIEDLILELANLNNPDVNALLNKYEITVKDPLRGAWVSAKEE